MFENNINIWKISNQVSNRERLNDYPFREYIYICNIYGNGMRFIYNKKNKMKI